MTLYMHTLDGKPAAFFPRDGVCFAHKRITLARSLRQIRKEQAESSRIRTDAGLSDDCEYGYVTVVA